MTFDRPRSEPDFLALGHDSHSMPDALRWGLSIGKVSSVSAWVMLKKWMKSKSPSRPSLTSSSGSSMAFRVKVGALTKKARRPSLIPIFRATDRDVAIPFRGWIEAADVDQAP